jgi:PAS domain S-box-containing protein
MLFDMADKTCSFSQLACSREAGYLLAIVGPLLAFGCWWMLASFFHGINPPGFFALAVILAAWRGGLGPGLVATALSLGLVDWFMVQPLHSLAILDPAERVRFAGFATSGMLLSVFGQVALAAGARVKRRSASLEQSEKRLRLALSGAQAGVWEWEISQPVISLSPELIALFGLVTQPGNTVFPRELLTELVHPEDRADAQRGVYDAIATGTQFKLEFRLVRPVDGRMVWISSVGDCERDLGGKPRTVRGVNFDITARKEAEIALAAAKKELEQANADLERRVDERTAALRTALEQLEGFSYSISHDLRAPLRAMTSFASILNDDHAGQLNPEARDYLVRIRDSAARMDALILDVLRYSQVACVEMPSTAVDIRRLVESILRQYPDLAGHAARVRFEPGASVMRIPCVQANEAALSQVLANLLGNALKFVPSGRTPEVIVRCVERDGHVRISILDNGVGIPLEHHKRIGGMFQRLHGAEYPGTGIGLSIVRKAVERMGGRFGFDSEPGRGSCFWVELPPAEAQEAPREDK